ncbi:class I SAM-dependent methyltransferase [Novosphingobium sp. MW5]|nr:class I SAM-dependent methyltransferase [Novosphingobium sp. MW5]
MLQALRHWYTRFMAQRDAAAALYDDRFVRLWKFYLAASEPTFRLLAGAERLPDPAGPHRADRAANP